MTKAYPLIVLSRFMEIGSRFIFLGLCLKTLDLSGYGEVSYKIALFQFIASALFASSLASMARVVPEELLSNLSAISLGLFGIFYLIFGTPALIFLFYSFLYILNGWYGVQESQARFGILRGLAFLGQLLFILYFPGVVNAEKIFLSFVVPALFMITQIPLSKIAIMMPSERTLKIYAKFQIQGLTFQFTKIVERWVAKVILDEHFFGLYSTFRDLINAANLTIFSPVYQTQFKRLATGAEYRTVLKRWITFWGSALVVAILFIKVFPEILSKITSILNLKLTSNDLIILGVLACIDFFKAFFLMIMEAAHRLKAMLFLNMMDIALQICLLIFLVIHMDYYYEIILMFFCRMTIITILSFWMNKKYESVNS